MKAICKIKLGLHFAKCRRFWWILECVQKLNIICWICVCLMCKYKGRINISEVQMVNIQCECSMLLVWFGMCWLLCGTLGGKLKFQLESTPDPAAPGIPAHGHRPLVNTRYWPVLFCVIWQTVWYLQLSWTGRWHRWHPPHSWHSLSFQQMSSSYKGQTPANGEPADSVRKSHTSPALYISGL